MKYSVLFTFSADYGRAWHENPLDVRGGDVVFNLEPPRSGWIKVYKLVRVEVEENSNGMGRDVREEGYVPTGILRVYFGQSVHALSSDEREPTYDELGPLRTTTTRRDGEGASSTANESGLRRNDEGNAHVTVSENGSRPRLPAHQELPYGAVEYDGRTHESCVVCLNALCRGEQAYLCRRSETGEVVRACRHVFHTRCLRMLTSTDYSDTSFSLLLRSRAPWFDRCPMCRARTGSFRSFPDIVHTDRREFFTLLSSEGRDVLTRDEALEVARSWCFRDAAEIDETFERCWATWDADGDGVLSFHEACEARGGFFDFIIDDVLTYRAEHPDEAVGETLSADEWTAFGSESTESWALALVP